ncbi:MAG: putative HAD-hydrolase [Methanoregula sp. PtaU1.Bin051]|nr:MAG: putative HAD-hydrolase [Methanoregula sp. PtaU1.Bin051]
MDVRGFLIDLDGVLYVGEKAIDGAREAIGLLKERGYRFRFVSNTTRKCRSTIAERLSRMGFSINETSIFTPPLAAIAKMNAEGKHRCMLITTGDVHKDFEQWCEKDTGSDAIDYVVVGDAGEAMTYEKLNRAFRLINAGAELIALEKDRFWMAPDGLMLSAGPFVAALEFATGKSATIMGKPSRQFFDMALRDMGLPADQVAMIGDDIITDIAGARKAGMRAVLVRTGKYSKSALDGAAIKPTAVIDSIAKIGEIL